MTTTPMPELPVPSGYGIKSIYGFDPQDGHKRLIGLSINKPDTWADSRTVQLYTADQMQTYAIAAIEAATLKANAELDDLRDTLQFVERWANHHGTKPHMTAEQALGCIQHYPSILAITRSYTNGKVPTTRNPWTELEAATEQGKRQPHYPEGDVVGPCVCGSWPGGKCLKCAWITATPQGNL